MHADSRPQHASTKPPLAEQGGQIGYENTTVTKVPGWHGIIAWDALLNGMAMGLFLTAAVSELAAPAVFMRVAKVAYPVALVLLLIDLGLLVLDLGDPLRFHHMLRVFKPSSPMSLGTWCLTIFSLPLTARRRSACWPNGGWDFEWARLLAVVVGLLPGFGAAAYKGVLLSTNAQPGWKDARWLGGYLTNSALLMGLRRAACPIGSDGANAGDRHPPHRLYRAARAQCDSLRAVVCEPQADPCPTLYPRPTMARWRAHRCRGADPFGSDAPQPRSARHIGCRDFSFIAELARPFCVRQDTSHFAIGSPKRRIVPAT